MIDSHCHIGFQGQDVAPILERARAAGVSHVLTVACSQTDYDDLIRLLKAEPSVYGAFGIHPESVNDMPTHDDFIHKAGAHKRLLAVGHGYFNRCVQAFIEQKSVRKTPRWENTELRIFNITPKTVTHNAPTDFIVSEN